MLFAEVLHFPAILQRSPVV